MVSSRLILIPLAGMLLALPLGCGKEKKPPPSFNPVVDPPTAWVPRDPKAGMKTLGPRRHELHVGKVPVEVRLALNDTQRQAGLGGIRKLAANEGMLFVYRDHSKRSFWMKGCLIPLDIAFLEQDGTVFQLATLAAPRPGATEQQIPFVESKKPVAMVLEMPAGFFARHGLATGARVHIPKSVPINSAR